MMTFSLRKNILCVPKSFITELVVNEAYEGGLMGHFREYKTFKHFFWPHMKSSVHHVCNKCLVYKTTKAKVNPHGLYTPLPIPTMPWVDLSKDFFLSLPRSKNGRDSIFVVVDKFSIMAYFIPCHKVDNACVVANLFFKEVSKLDNKLFFSTACHPQTDGWIEITNRTLSQLLRCLKSWEERLPHIDFAYNRVVNTTTSHSPLELVYVFNLLSSLDLLPFPNISFMLNYYGTSKAQFVNDLHAKARSHVEKKVEQYANEANKVWVHLRKKRFPNLRKKRFSNLRKYKLLPRGDGPFKVLIKFSDRVGDNSASESGGGDVM
ncbi:Tf2-8, partial [Mucuna pruriens]